MYFLYFVFVLGL